MTTLNTKRGFGSAGLILVILIIIGGGLYLWSQKSTPTNVPKNYSLIAEEKLDSLVGWKTYVSLGINLPQPKDVAILVTSYELKNLFQKMIKLREYGYNLPHGVNNKYLHSSIRKEEMAIPKEATLMSVEFTFTNSTGGEKFNVILGTGGKNVYSVGAKDLEDNVFETSRLIDVSDYSSVGKAFVAFKFLGDEDVNGKDGGGELVLKNLRFYKPLSVN